jgi:ArsR family transcriptional regulator
MDSFGCSEASARGPELGYSGGVPQTLTPRARERVAERFRALGEPNRLRILERLFRSPASVSEILSEVGGTQANVSKHLRVLLSGGLVRRRREGLQAVYSIADPDLERLCALVCNAVVREAREDAAALAAPPRARRRSG